jgi:2-polyprenyl-3-methyl-5-hydroxy-6-metoxy-1,4-benzoquinol methylase
MSAYEDYIEKYRKLHAGESLFHTAATGEVMDYGKYKYEFSGVEFTRKFIPYIEQYIKKVQRSITILDYGCGKGFMPWGPYRDKTRGVWGHFADKIRAIWLYDPTNPPFAEKPPEGLQFDVVGAADVLEHIPEESVEFVIRDIDSFTKPDGVIILSISGIPALKTFDDGENLHCTLKDAKWWANTIVKNTKKQFVIIYQGANRTTVIPGNIKK